MARRPVPFAYYHISVVLMYFTYTIFSIILVPQQSTWTILFLFMSILIISGMREIAAAMSDPFGDDEGDLPTEKFIRDVRAHGCIIATADTRPPINGHSPVLMVPELVERVPGFFGGIFGGNNGTSSNDVTVVVHQKKKEEELL